MRAFPLLYFFLNFRRSSLLNPFLNLKPVFLWTIYFCSQIVNEFENISSFAKSLDFLMMTPALIGTPCCDNLFHLDENLVAAPGTFNKEILLMVYKELEVELILSWVPFAEIYVGVDCFERGLLLTAPFGGFNFILSFFRNLRVFQSFGEVLLHIK